MTMWFTNVQHIECFIIKTTSYGSTTCIDFEIDNVHVAKILVPYQWSKGNYRSIKGQNNVLSHVTQARNTNNYNQNRPMDPITKGSLFGPERRLKEFILTWGTFLENAIWSIFLIWIWTKIADSNFWKLDQNCRFKLLKIGP